MVRKVAYLMSLAVVSICLFSFVARPAASLADTPIEFEPPHSNYTTDTDGDGLFEYLTVEVGVYANEPGWYFVVGVVYTNETRWFSDAHESIFAPFDVGYCVTELTYIGSEIVSNALEGTFYAALELYDRNSVKLATSVYTLGYYDYEDFNGTATSFAAFEGPHSDEGLDTNSDGIFDYLALGVRVNVTIPGAYGITAFISGLSDNETGDARNSTYLEAGVRVVELRFNGGLFTEAQVDGPYSVRLELMDAEFNRFYESDSFTTQDYDWTEFASSGASFEGPHSDASLDVNDDGAMEFLAVYVKLNVSVTGTYNVTGTLSVVTHEIGRQWCRSELETGSREVTLLFPGDVVRASMYNGSFRVALDLFDASQTWLWNYLHLTEYYMWIDFARPPLAIASATVVADGTSLNVTLDASESAVDTIEYEVRWDFDSDGVWDTDWSKDRTIVHEFPGPGTFTVVLQVRDLRGLTSESVVQVTVYGPPVVRLPSDDRFPIVTVAVATGLLAAVALLVYAWPVEVLITAAMALLMPLYSRLREDDLLDNYRRGMIHGLILAHPGICFTDIKEALSISTGPLVYHLGVLQRSGHVICRKSGALTRYYINGTPLSQIARLGLTDFQVEIVRLVMSKGRMTKRDIQETLGASRQVVHYNLKKLVTDKILSSSLAGGHRLYKMSISGSSGEMEEFAKELSAGVVVRRSMDVMREETSD